MSSLREVKDRIASVRGTLKITSAMKLVASSKLRRAQRAIEALRPYEEALASMLAAASSSAFMAGGVWGQRAINLGQRPFDPIPHRPEDTVESGQRPLGPSPRRPEDTVESGQRPFDPIPRRPESLRPEDPAESGDADERPGRAVVVAFSSNSSMCGAFNSNVIKRTLSEIRAISASGRQVEAWAFGKKVAEALRKASVPVERDYTSLVSHSEYSAVAAIAQELRALSASGDVDSVLLVYNHFVSTGRQEVVVEPYLGAAQLPNLQGIAQFACTKKDAGKSGKVLRDKEIGGTDGTEGDYILEPSRGGLLEFLMPQVLDLRLYAALLDSAAAEHAARMIAMQAATDNGESLLAELTLEYNKGRQQKITSEILDLVGGSAQ